MVINTTEKLDEKGNRDHWAEESCDFKWGPGKACNVKGFAFVFKEQQDQCGWNGGNEGQRSRR